MNQELILRAFQDNGIAENPSFTESNQTILSIIKRFFPNADDDSKYAWCGMWLDSVFRDLNLIPPNTPELARSWLKVGDTINNLESADIGDLVIFWRGSKDGWKGHVGLFCGFWQDNVFCFGGNQYNRVGMNVYSASRLLGIRRVCPSNINIA